MHSTTEQQIIEAYAEQHGLNIDQLLWTLALNNLTIQDILVEPSDKAATYN
jgi:aminoglycoside phosphotransferase (APT) family kinase protein